MRAIVVTDQTEGTAGMTLTERPEPQPSINDVVVRVHASGFVNTELGWPSTWRDRLDRDRTPTIPGPVPDTKYSFASGSTPAFFSAILKNRVEAVFGPLTTTFFFWISAGDLIGLFVPTTVTFALMND